MPNNGEMSFFTLAGTVAETVFVSVRAFVFFIQFVVVVAVNIIAGLLQHKWQVSLLCVSACVPVRLYVLMHE